MEVTDSVPAAGQRDACVSQPLSLKQKCVQWSLHFVMLSVRDKSRTNSSLTDKHLGLYDEIEALLYATEMA